MMKQTKLVRILHITESHAKADGGVTTVVNDLAYHLNSLGVYSCILAATDKVEPVPDGVDFVKMGEKCNAISALFSSELKASVRSWIQEKKINVIHIHGIWMPLQNIASCLAKEMGIPFIVTSHGMLEPWLWTGKGKLNYLKKKLYFKLFAYPAFRAAKLIHAITPNEETNLKELFSKNKTVTLPNAIDDAGVQKYLGVAYEKRIFFIGRINPKKGVDLLLRAYKESGLCVQDWSLLIAGPEEVPEYVQELRQFIQENGLESKVQLIGSVYGHEKENLYKNAWVTVVPSYSEVVGMVNLEASLYSCPTITTHQTGLCDWEEGGGMLIEPTVASLTAALTACSQWSENERKERGFASYDLVQEKYAWRVVSKQWKVVYEAMLEEN